MATAFSLFGELSVDTRAFVAAMRYADNRMKASERLFIEMEKSKMRMAERSASHQQKLSEITARAIQKSLSGIGSAMESAGKGLTVGVTAPLLAIEGSAIKSAIGFDTLRTQLAAATGSTASANDKFKELNKLAQENAGVLTAGAVATYNFLKPLGITEETINETIKAFGKLKAANPEVDLQRTATNLGQLFDQGFEQQDVKELVGNFPRALEIMKNAFGLKSSDRKAIAKEMRALVEGGLTREQFFAAFAGGVNSDAFLSKVTDPIAVRFEKMKERIALALEPLGAIILTNLERWAPYVVAFIERISAAFTALSPTMQMVVTALSAVAIAAGPVLFALGQIVSAIASFGISAPAIGTVAAVLAGLAAVLAPIIVTATFFSQEWLRNWEIVKQIFQEGYEAVSGVVVSMLTTLQGFWTEHGAAIMDYLSSWWNTLATAISDWFGVVAEVLTVVLNIIKGDWEATWNSILALTEQLTGMLAVLFTNALKTVGNLISAYGPIFIQGFTWIFSQLLDVVSKAAWGLVQIFLNLPQILISLIPKFIAAGMQIGSAIQSGIAQGIKNWFNPTAQGDIGGGIGSNPFQNIVDSFKQLFAGSGPKAGLEGGLGGFLTPATTQANTLSTALDKVTEKAKKAKAAVLPKISDATMRAAEKAGIAAQKKGLLNTIPGAVYATMTGADGKARKIFSIDTMLSGVTPLVPPGSQANMMSDIDALERVAKAASEGKLFLEITDSGKRTSIGATSANVEAKYKN